MKLLFVFLFIPAFAFAQTYELKQVAGGTNTSLRGMSIVSDQVAWVSGSNGYVGKTTNGGKDWEWMQPKGFETLDFRDIEAFGDQKAILMNAGSPAYVLLTENGGKSWVQVYVNQDSAIFLDGMDFWNKDRGIIFGDPIDGHLQVLTTENGGNSWKMAKPSRSFTMQAGEAGFAASGSSIKAQGEGRVWIATGGSISNVYFSDNFGKRWKKYPCPILQGANSTGAFAIDFFDYSHGVVVGGDYLNDKNNSNNVLTTTNGGKSWNKPKIPVSGFRSCVTYLNQNTLLASGTSGLDVSSDRGITWKHLSDGSSNTVKKAKTGTLILLAGNNGYIYSLSSH
jgi:photosystem II stability/assembly factor-like uncharacterized protein